MAAKRCCGTSVGAIVTDSADRMLMIERGWFPVGVAPVAGHVADEHADPDAALVAEVAEETGLTVTSHWMAWTGWLPNLCASLPARVPGHSWAVGFATVTGDLAPDPRETKGASWRTETEVGALALRTLDYAYGHVGDADFADRPGMEPVWLELMEHAGLAPVELTERDRELLRRLYTTPPRGYWVDGALVLPAELAAT